MRNMQNYVQLTGRLFDLPSPRRVSDGSYVLNLRLSTGPRPENAEEVHHLIAWNQLAMEISQRFKRGSRIMVAGELRNRLQTKDGVNYYRTEILIREFQALKDRTREEKSINKVNPTKAK
jgi:single-stranded DNA-binding protein